MLEGREEGRKEGREGGREERRKEGREERRNGGRKGGTEEGRKGRREEGTKGGKEERRAWLGPRFQGPFSTAGPERFGLGEGGKGSKDHKRSE